MSISTARTPCTIHILFMEHEIDATERVLASLTSQLQPHDHISLLLNGAVRPDLRQRFSAFPNVHYHESAANLGVAGGRNFLFQQPESMITAATVLLDNDAVVPCDYLDRILTFLDAHPEAGIVGPVTLVYGRVAAAMTTNGNGFDVSDVTSADLLDALRQSRNPEWIDHLGTNPDWRNVYLHDRNAADILLSSCDLISDRIFYGLCKMDPQICGSLFNGEEKPLPVANIAGCCQVFRRALLDEIGSLNTLFNPYGWEDVEFAVRALRQGYCNLIDTGTAILHGTDQRHADRAAWRGYGPYHTNQGRIGTLFEYLTEPDTFPARSLERITLIRLLNRMLSPGRAGEQYYLMLTGLHQAVAQLRQRFGSEVDDRIRRTLGDAKAVSLLGHTHPLADLAGASTALPLSPAAGLPTADARNANKQITIQRETLRDHERGVAVPPYPAAKASAYIQPGFGVRLNRFRNLHAGKRAFIIGNGPSLNRTDLSFLWDEVSFGVNGIFYMTDQTGFRPTYYCVEDNHVIDDNLERITEYDTSVKFFPHKYRHSIPAERNVYFLPTDWEFYHTHSPHFENPRFSNNIDQVIYVGQTVTYLNMQMAFFMGFSEVYLIGVDFDYQVPPESPIEGFSILSQDDDPNHFHPEYFGKGKKWHFPKLHNCLKSYEFADRHFRAHGRRILNATVGGKLECFERVDYHSLFKAAVPLSAPNTPLIQMSNLVLRKSMEAGQATGGVLIMAGGDAVSAADMAHLFARSIAGGVARSGIVLTGDDIPVLAGVEALRGDDLPDLHDVPIDMVVADLKRPRIQAPRLAALLGRARCAVLSGLEPEQAGGLDALATPLATGRSVWVLNGTALICDRAGHGFLAPLDPAALVDRAEMPRCNPVTAMEWLLEPGRFQTTLFCSFPMAEGIAAWITGRPESLAESAFGCLLAELTRQHRPYLLTDRGLYVRLGRRP